MRLTEIHETAHERSDFERWTEDLELCARCGKCRAVCPVFQETLSEAMVARGRIELMQALVDERVSGSRELGRILGSCIRCLRCASQCPSGVPYGVLISSARSRLGILPGGGAWMRFVLRHVVPRRRLFGAALKMASIGLSLWPGRRRGRLRHLPLLAAGWRWLPQIVWRPALSRLKGGREPRGDSNEKARTAVFFVGCLGNHVYPRVAEAAVDLLARAGYRVVVPERQVCCGMSALTMGDLAAFEKVLRLNREALLAAKPDVIVTACATCGVCLKKEYEHLTGADAWDGVPVRDVTEVLAESDVISSARRRGERVTYHDPCHLAQVQGVREQPRLLLSAVEFVEMRNADKCCGGGGAFTMLCPEISAKVSAHKADAIREAAPDVVATACPGCMMRLEEIMAEWEEDVRVKHVVEVLEEAMNPGSAGPQRGGERG